MTRVAPMRARLGQRSKIFGLPIMVILLALIVPLLVRIVILAFSNSTGTAATLDNFVRIWNNGVGLQILGNTLLYTLGATFVAILVALVIAIIVERTDAPGRIAVYAMLALGFGVPSVIHGIGWTLIGGRVGILWNIFPWLQDVGPNLFYSWFGLCIVTGLRFAPIAFFLVAPALRAMDPSLEEAARVAGAGRFRMLTRITLGLSRPSLLAAVFLVGLLVVQHFDLPALIGTQSGFIVLSTEVYSLVQRNFPDYNGAAAYSIVLAIVAVIALVAYFRATAQAKRFGVISGKGYRSGRVRLEGWRIPSAILVIVLAFCTVVPVLVLLWRSFVTGNDFPCFTTCTYGFSNFSDIGSTAGLITSGVNSIVLGLLAGLIVVLLTVLLSWVTVRESNRITRLLDQLGSIPLVLSGILLSLAFLQTYAKSFLYNSVFLILIAYVVFYIPFGVRFTYSAVVGVRGELEEAASVAGARPTTVFRRIVFPLVLPSLLTAFVFIFLASMEQLSLVVFISGAGNPVVGPEIFRLWQTSSISVVAAFSVGVVLAGFIIVGAGWLISRLVTRHILR